MSKRDVTMLVPSMGRVGGAETIIRGLTKGLERRNWSVRWVVSQGAVDVEEAVPSVRYRGSGLIAGLQVATRFRGLIHSHFAFSAWGHTLMPSRIPRIRTFYGPWSHEGVLAEAPSLGKTSLREGLELLSLTSAGLVVALSRFSVGQLRARYVPQSKIRIVPGFVDADRFPAAKQRRPTRRPNVTLDPLLVTNRRLVPRMGVHLLLEAMPLLPSRYSTVRLEVLGEGPQKAELVELARRLGLEARVAFRGRVSDQDLSLALSRADLAVVPSQALEGFGLATVEALWHGTPALVTPVGANPEIVEDLDPWLVARGTEPAALAASIAELLDRRDGWDPDRAREYARDRYSLDRMVEATMAVYEEAFA